jgi:hypothetical protein
MTRPNHPAADHQRVRPYAMTGGRTRPTHDALAIETLVSTTCTVDLTPKLTVEQRAISALCHEILWSPRRDSNPRPSDTESDDKASGPEWEDSCGAEGDARPPHRRPMPSRGGVPFRAKITSIG